MVLSSCLTTRTDPPPVEVRSLGFFAAELPALSPLTLHVHHPFGGLVEDRHVSNEETSHEMWFPGKPDPGVFAGTDGALNSCQQEGVAPDIHITPIPDIWCGYFVVTRADHISPLQICRMLYLVVPCI